jgi:hypothetical protein
METVSDLGQDHNMSKYLQQHERKLFLIKSGFRRKKLTKAAVSK